VQQTTDKEKWRFTLSGTAINTGVTHFTDWLDEFLIRSAGLMIMVGMMAGTLDVFTTVGLIKIPWFTLVWAGVQSIAIDGLFFAVWRRIRRLWRTVANRWTLTPLIGVGIILAIIAGLIAATLSYQQLNGSSDVATAMATLGIDKTMFSYVRSFLVVIVAILIVLVIDDAGHEHEATHTQAMQGAHATPSPVAQRQSPRARVTEATSLQAASPDRGPKGQAMVLPKRATSMDHSLDTRTHSPMEEATARVIHSPQETGYIAVDDGSTVAIANGQGATMIATGSHRDRIKQAMLQAIQKGEEATYNEIAKAAGVGYSTVKKHAPAIKMEIAASTFDSASEE
jgi:hypothetical protein